MMYPLQQGLRGLVVPPKATAGAAGIGKTMWRILFLTTVGGTAITTNNVEFRSEPSGANLTPSSGVSLRGNAISQSSATSGPYYAFNPSGSLYIAASGTDEALIWRFDGETAINEVSYRNSNSSARVCNSISVQSSVDGGATWVDEWSDTSMALTANTIITSTRP